MKLQDLCPVPLPQAVDLPIEVFIEAGAAQSVPYAVQTHLGQRIFAVADPDTWNAANKVIDLRALFGDQFCVHTLPPHPKGKMELLDELAEQIHDVDGLLAIGSGTINDLVKSLSERFEKPSVVLGTAASMNGYASSIAALMDKGLKVTVPATPPRAIILDLDILKDAPLAMAQAGLADLLSKPVSGADWWVASRLGESEFNPLPGRIVDHAVQQAVANAEGIPSGDLGSLQALAEACVLSGVSMAVAGNSSPASGGEHLISHLWDMERLQQNLPMNLHGAQVGLTVCLSTAIYHALMQYGSPAFPEPPGWEHEAVRIPGDHGILADSVLPQTKLKHDGASARREQLIKLWSQLRQELIDMNIPTPQETHDVLRKAHAPDTLNALSLSTDDALRGLRISRDIRSRYTVLDLAFELGLFPEAIPDILTASGV
ncbi:MAG: iron-containing alcohol dehydrogenase [Candidatus Hinthialibacter antarcticus]|nr:iron-containing alcohol dehydrogenase [Candidatus Hinthialibacter antarcticus]